MFLHKEVPSKEKDTNSWRSAFSVSRSWNKSTPDSIILMILKVGGSTSLEAIQANCFSFIFSKCLRAPWHKFFNSNILNVIFLLHAEAALKNFKQSSKLFIQAFNSSIPIPHHKTRDWPWSRQGPCDLSLKNHTTLTEGAKGLKEARRLVYP